MVVYVGWNAFWLCQQRIPPSLFTGLTGLPCPTTGGTRACRCLVEGKLTESLRLNAMAVPLLAMFLATVGMATYRYIKLGAATLAWWIVPWWLGLLAVAWVLNLLRWSGCW